MNIKIISFNLTRRDRPAMIPNRDAVLTLTAPVAVYPVWKAIEK